VVQLCYPCYRLLQVVRAKSAIEHKEKKNRIRLTLAQILS
jgi:hypothetical protein